MPHRAVSWSALSHTLHHGRPVIPPGLLSARAQMQFAARRRPLFVAGRSDMSAIMAAAAVAASCIQERYGLACAAAPCPPP